MKTMKKIITIFLVAVMVLGLLPTTLIPTKAYADNIEDYRNKWPITGAQYTVYTTDSAARTARDNVKAGLPAGTEGIAKDIDGNDAIFTVNRSGNTTPLSFFVGTYYVVETKVPNGWNADEEVYTMNIVPNGPADNELNGLVTSKETPRFFKFNIQKTVTMDSTFSTVEEYKQKYPIAGAKYALFTDETYANSLLNLMNTAETSHSLSISYDASKVAKDEDGNNIILTTDAQGKTNMVWLDSKQVYYMVEVERPQGYQFDHTVHTVSSNIGNVTITENSAENPAYIYLKVVKRWSRDSWVQDVNPDQYNLKISWILYKDEISDNNIIATGETDENGNMIGDPIKVPLGKYIFVETGVGENSGKIYVDENGETSSVTISATTLADEFTTKDGQLTNAPIDPKWHIVLTKVIDENDEQFYDHYQLKGTQFTVYYLSDPTLTEDQVLTTDSNGVIVASDYTKANAIKTWIFEAKDNDQVWYTTYDSAGNMIIIPQNIIYYDNNYLAEDSPDKSVFMEDGENPQPIMLIGTYVFEETRTTTGLSKMDSWKWSLSNNGENTIFSYNDINRYDEEHAIAANSKQTITIKIKKSSDSENQENYYGSVEGAKFLLEYLDPITSEWKLATAMDINSQETDVSILITDADGNAQSVPMKPGTYRLTELEPPRGHVLNPDEGDAGKLGKPFVLGTMGVENNGQRNFEFYYDWENTDGELENTATHVILSKVGYDDNGNKIYLSGATMQLWELDNNGNTITQLKVNGEINFKTTNEPIHLYGLTIGTSYKFIEIEAPDGYLMPEGEDAYKVFTVRNTTNPVMIEFENEKEPELKSLAYTVNGVKEQLVDSNAIIEDHFWVSKLLPNKHYIFNGKLVNASNHDEIIATKTFEFNTDSTQTEFDLVFTFNASELGGKTLEVIGELYREGRVSKVATHYDTEDLDETIVIPMIGTYAFDKSKEDDHIYASYILNEGTGIISDRVDYEKLITGNTYEIETKIVDENGNIITNLDGAEIQKYRFDATTDNGSVTIDIKFNAFENQGKTITVYEYVYSFNADYERVLIAKHEDLTDTKQQVTVPEIKTTASEQVITNEENAEDYKFKVTDFVEYNHLPANTTFIGIATVMNPETNEALVDSEGNTFTAETEFTTDENGSGSYNVTIEIPYALVEGKDIVMFEEVKNSELNLVIANHIDWEDTNQTVEFPEIKTVAWFVNNEVLTKNGLKENETFDLVDKVTLSNLEKDKEYVVNAEIYIVKADGAYELVKKSDDVTYIATGSTTEEVEVTFTGIELPELAENDKFVVMEYLYDNEVLVGKHFDTADDDQTVRIPDFHTTATDKVDDDKYLFNDDIQTVVDVFHYENLTPGVEVKLVTSLVDEEGNPLKDAEGNEIKQEMTFTPEEVSGDITIEFEIDAKFFEGQIITVFEDLYENNVLVGMHHDLSQETQTVYVPEIKTTASEQVITDDEDAGIYVFKVTDIVNYKNLPKETTLIGVASVMNPETNEVLVDENGKEYTAEVEFTTDATGNGSYEVTIEIPYSLIEGKDIVMFEEVKNGDVVLAHHIEWDDEEQTVEFPAIKTSAWFVDGEETKTLTKNGLRSTWINIVDKVTLYNLEKDVEYVLKAEIYLVKEDNTYELVRDSIDVTYTGKAEEFELVDIPINNVELPENIGDSRFVIMEYLYNNGILIGKHFDVTDVDQTIRVPDFCTNAMDKEDEDKFLFNEGTQIIIDEFHYDNLTPGVEVRLDAYLTDEYGHELHDAEGNRISIEEVFTPETTSGDITLTFEIDAKFFEGKTIIVFEDLYENDVLVGVHHELTQETQTVYVPGIKTIASYVENKEEETYSFDLVDVVDYKNFPVGKTMVVYAKLMDVETKEIAKDTNGNDLLVRYEFVPETMNGTYEIKFTVPVDLVKGRTFVFFETAYEVVETETENEDGTTETSKEEKLFAKHEDWEDTDQTLPIPEIHTKAELANTVIGEDGKINILDTITYVNLKVGTEYTMVGTLMDLATHQVLVDSNNNPVQAIATFTAEEVNSADDLNKEVCVTFSVDEDIIVGHEVVIFERAYVAYGTDNEELIATHEDWEDADQTVEVPIEVTVSIYKLDSKNEKVLLKGAEITVFNADGTVAIDKWGNECIGLTDENGEVTFVLLKSKTDEYYAQETKAPAGYHINVNKFELDLTGNTKYKVEIDVHINDMAIIIPPVRTGDENHLVLWIVILSAALLVAGGACFFIFKKKKNNKVSV